MNERTKQALPVIVLIAYFAGLLVSLSFESAQHNNTTPTEWGTLKGNVFCDDCEATEPTRIALPETYVRILRDAGWLQFVYDNVERIELLPVSSFWAYGVDAYGMSEIVDGKRTAIVATKRDPVDVCATIVHEAKHLELSRTTRFFASQLDAYTAEAQFKRDYAAAWMLDGFMDITIGN